MPSVTLTEFYEYLSASGMKKAAVVKKLKDRDTYSPKRDYYKGFRGAVQSYHSSLDGGELKEYFKNFLKGGISSGKANNYRRMCDGYRKFRIAGPELEWTPSKKYEWRHEDLIVRVAPIWSYRLENELLIVKPHLAKASLTRAGDRMTLMLCLMREAISTRQANKVALLDVGNSKLYPHETVNPVASQLLKAEAATFLILYDQV